MSKLNSIQRLLGAAGAGLALCAFALPASAQQAQQEAVQSVDSQVVTRDAETGKLRPATAAEQATLQSLKAMMREAPKPTLQKFHSNGATGVRLTDEFLSAATVVRNADGKLETICTDAHGSQPAAAHVHTAANTPVTE
jgi:hypothetical protein